FHWCAGCWDWVCDCLHFVEPLNIKRQPVNDIQIRSVGYDRRRGRLEIEFFWTDDVRQFHPIPPGVYRQLLAAEPIYLFLNRLFCFEVTKGATRQNRSRPGVDDGERVGGLDSSKVIAQA